MTDEYGGGVSPYSYDWSIGATLGSVGVIYVGEIPADLSKPYVPPPGWEWGFGIVPAPDPSTYVTPHPIEVAPEISPPSVSEPEPLAPPAPTTLEPPAPSSPEPLIPLPPEFPQPAPPITATEAVADVLAGVVLPPVLGLPSTPAPTTIDLPPLGPQPSWPPQPQPRVSRPRGEKLKPNRGPPASGGLSPESYGEMAKRAMKDTAKRKAAKPAIDAIEGVILKQGPKVVARGLGKVVLGPIGAIWDILTPSELGSGELPPRPKSTPIPPRRPIPSPIFDPLPRVPRPTSSPQPRPPPLAPPATLPPPGNVAVPLPTPQLPPITVAPPSPVPIPAPNPVKNPVQSPRPPRLGPILPPILRRFRRPKPQLPKNLSNPTPTPTPLPFAPPLPMPTPTTLAPPDPLSPPRGAPTSDPLTPPRDLTGPNATPLPFASPLQFANAPQDQDECRKCEEQKKKRRQNGFSGIVAQVHQFRRRMSKNSIANLKKGK